MCMCAQHIHKFIAFAHDISTGKAFRNFSHLKRLRLWIDDAFSGETVGCFSVVVVAFWKAEKRGIYQFKKQQDSKEKQNLIRKLCWASGKSSWMCYLVSLWRICMCVSVSVLRQRRETDMNKVLDFWYCVCRNWNINHCEFWNNNILYVCSRMNRTYIFHGIGVGCRC